MRSGLVWVAAIAGCGRIGFDDRTSASDAGADARTTCVWSPALVVANVNSASYDWEPALSPDGRVLVFTRSPLGQMGPTHLFVAIRPQPTDPFGAPVLSSGLLGPSSDAGAVWTPDGTQLYFVSDRLVVKSPRLWVSTYLGNGMFQPPATVAELANESLVGPGLSHDGLEMFYCDGEMMGTTTAAMMMRRATRATTSSPWVVQGVVAEISTPGGGCFPTLSPDGLTMYFESHRDNVDGLIYQAARPAIGAAFGAITRVDDLDAGAAAAGDPELSPDGLGMIFAAARPGNQGLQDLYTSRLTCP